MSVLPKLEMPTYLIRLPLSNKTIKYRPMVQKDEKLLLMAKEGEDKTEILEAIKQVCVNCCLDETIDMNEISIIDLEFFFINLRSSSVSNITKVAYVDNGDEQTRTFDIDLTKVKVIIPDPGEEGTPSPDVTVNDTLSIKLRYPPATLYSDKDFLHSEGSDALSRLVAACIDKIVSENSTVDVAKSDLIKKEELDDFLQGLPVPVYSKLTDWVSKLPHLEYVIDYTNNQGVERKIVLSSLNDFFTLA